MSSGGFIIDKVQGAQRVDTAATDVRPVIVGSTAEASTPTSVTDGNAVRLWLDIFGRTHVTISAVDAAAILKIVGTLSPDAAFADLVKPVIIGSAASASAPSPVSADGDAVQAWIDRSGRLCIFADPALLAQGDEAHDAVDAGNPVKIGGFASLSVPPGVTTGDRVNAYFDLQGRQVVILGGAANAFALPIIGFLAHDASGAQTIKPVIVGGRALAAAVAPVADNDAVLMWLDTVGRVAVWDGDLALMGQGDAAHDAADAGKPIKIGGKASSGAPTNVGDNDRVNAYFDLKGRLGVHDGEQALMGQGDVAHDGVDSGKPIKTGGKAVAHGASPTAVAAADRTDALYNRHGMPFNIAGHPNTQRKNTQLSSASTGTFATPASGKRFVVMALSAYADKANTNGTECKFLLGSTVIARHPGVAAGSGFVEAIGGILAIGAADEALKLTVTDPGGTIDGNVTYYEIDS